MLRALYRRFPHLIRRLPVAAMLAATFPAAAAPATTAVAPVYIDSLRNYGFEQGLPQASANTLLQGNDGYLWIGTFGGLVRFDGKQFKTFHADLGDSASPQQAMAGPASERILKLLEDRDHRMWIATEDAGLNLYRDGQFHALTSICGGGCSIGDLASSDGKIIWAMGSDAIYRIDAGDLGHERLDLQGRSLSFVDVLADGSVYASGLSGLARIGAAGIEPIALPTDDTRFIQMSVIGEGLWLFSERGNLYRYAPVTGELQRVRTGLPYDTHLVIAGDGRGYISDSVAGTRILADSGEETPLIADQPVHAVAIREDDAGNLWIGTPTQGLWRLRRSRVGLMASPAVKMDQPARAVVGDGRGGLWFGIGCDGLRHWNVDGGMQTLMLKPALRDECVSSLLLDRRGDLWISTGAQLGKLVQGGVQWQADWPQTALANVWQSRDGNYWVYTSAGTYRLDVGADGNVRGRTLIAALQGMHITYMADARRGGTWFVGSHGAYRLQGGRIVEQWDASRNGVHARQIRALFEDDDGGLWIGTYGAGLIRVKDGVMRQFDESSGLFDNTVSCILPDDRGRLWLAGNRGLTVLGNPGTIDRDGRPEIALLASGDGLIPPEVNGGVVSACHRDERGRLWISLIQGFAMVDPARFNDLTPHVPVVHIERIRVNGNDVALAAPIVLGTKAANMEIGFSGIEMAHPELLRYRYRVSATGGNWTETGDNDTLLIPTLPWGRFSFEVQASVLGGAWSPSATVEFDHPRPWYRYQSAWLLASIVALLGLLWLTRDEGRSGDYARILEEVRRAEAERERDEAP
ncbi:MAG: two-component regulator propeller domain-containing protein [Pseudoxanthomonas sp.]